MYDVDNNGYIEREEMLEIVKAIYAIKPEYVKQLNTTADDFVHSIYRVVFEVHFQRCPIFGTLLSPFLSSFYL